jgi:hypothetical protein
MLSDHQFSRRIGLNNLIFFDGKINMANSEDNSQRASFKLNKIIKE